MFGAATQNQNGDQTRWQERGQQSGGGSCGTCTLTTPYSPVKAFYPISPEWESSKKCNYSNQRLGDGSLQRRDRPREPHLEEGGIPMVSFEFMQLVNLALGNQVIAYCLNVDCFYVRVLIFPL